MFNKNVSQVKVWIKVCVRNFLYFFFINLSLQSAISTQTTLKVGKYYCQFTLQTLNCVKIQETLNHITSVLKLIAVKYTEILTMTSY